MMKQAAWKLPFEDKIVRPPLVWAGPLKWCLVLSHLHLFFFHNTLPFPWHPKMSCPGFLTLKDTMAVLSQNLKNYRQ